MALVRGKWVWVWTLCQADTESHTATDILFQCCLLYNSFIIWTQPTFLRWEIVFLKQVWNIANRRITWSRLQRFRTWCWPYLCSWWNRVERWVLEHLLSSWTVLETMIIEEKHETEAIKISSAQELYDLV